MVRYNCMQRNNIEPIRKYHKNEMIHRHHLKKMLMRQEVA